MNITVMSEVLEFTQFVNTWGDRFDAAGIEVNAGAHMVSTGDNSEEVGGTDDLIEGGVPREAEGAWPTIWMVSVHYE